MALGLGTAVLSTLALAALLLWRFVLRPVRRLEHAMTVAATGDLTVRAPVTSTDEIGALTSSWNDLVGELGRARSELETWNATLETRVADATQALERAHRNMAFVEKMASLGKLAAVVAHELNNPLAGIATYAKLLRRRLGSVPGTPDVEVARALELVETEAVRCGGIVRNLLTFSRTTGSRFAEEDLRPYLDRCVMLLRHQADLQNVALSLDVAPDLPRVVCDGAQVQQAVLALATNAIEAMPGGGRLAISARHDPVAREAVLEVADDGCGIEEKDLPHVFEPFFTTKEQGKGVGLGLAVVYGIATRHHGRVEVRSRAGEGTRFTVSLPLRPPEAPVPLAQGATP
jgi:two-component system NtrC family sensor kinase